MRMCANCGKSNLPTRKFCIRCGRSLLTDTKEKKPVAAKVETKVDTAKAETPAAKTADATDDGEDRWVKPSEVSRDRVRAATGAKRMTELEKARAAFAQAEEVGIEEGDTGVVVTRMLRASEVKELMEGVTAMHGSEVSEDDEPIVGPPPIAAPSPKDIEEQILGSHSAYVEKKPEPEPMVPSDDARVSATLSNEFSSSRYDEIEAETISKDDDSETAVFSAVNKPPETPPPATAPLTSESLDYDAITACPSCGEIVNIDQFEYPSEIYSAMGSARIKQARFFVVQGKYEQAQKIVRIARSLFMKANDEAGLAEVGKLVDSLARRG
ncbi:MAG: zinc ribbon domain-containing protein [Candidatus Thorarchaeota archaeon]